MRKSITEIKITDLIGQWESRVNENDDKDIYLDVESDGRFFLKTYIDSKIQSVVKGFLVEPFNCLSDNSLSIYESEDIKLVINQILYGDRNEIFDIMLYIGTLGPYHMIKN